MASYRRKDRQLNESGLCGCISVSHKSNMLKQYSHIKIDEEQIVPAYLILEMLYRGQDAKQALLQCRLNPNLASNGFRDDLEYFIPQLIHHILESNEDSLLDFIMKASEIDFFFAHTFFFAWRSEVTDKQPEVENYLKLYLQTQSRLYQETLLVAAYFENIQFKDGIEQQISKGLSQRNVKAYQQPELADYGTKFYKTFVMSEQLHLDNYTSVYKNPEKSGFCSTIDFWDDIIHISENLHLADPKLISLKADIQKINRNLPAAVYVPFMDIRNYVILNIVIDELRVFSTKCRSPFYLCIELYRPEEEQELIPNPFKEDRISLPRIVGKSEIRKSIDTSLGNETTQDYTRLRPTIMCKIVEEVEEEQKEDQIQDSLLNKEVSNSYYDDLSNVVTQSTQSPTKKNRQQLIKMLFPEDQTDKIKNKSPFKNYRTWRLVHLIVKSGDDLKQEQFAMQLIQQFDQIFKTEQLNLYLTTYEVISLGPGYGLIECVQNSMSIDSFKQKLNNIFQFKSLSEYFKLSQSQSMIGNFLSSLVAYSLVCYFLQIKDRHNGNILIHKDGYLIHIDFGFFLSNAPKGNLEKDVPFKLLSEYVDILGGFNSNLFKRFRRMFFEGFKAIRKNKQKILLLVKTMSNSGLKCFKGDTVDKLEQRFFNEDLSDNDLYVECQKLIDKSLDNWRARWYDKYQYYFQNIFY